MESFTRSFSTTSVDVNKAWRTKIHDVGVNGGPDCRQTVKTAQFGEVRRGRLWKIKKLFNLGGGADELPATATVAQKSKPGTQRSLSIAGSRSEFERRLMSEIYKNLSSSHELSSMHA